MIDAKSEMRDGSCAEERNFQLYDLNDIQQDLLLGRQSHCWHNKRLCSVISISGFDPNILNNIEKSELHDLINWRDEFESDDTSGFVCFPLLFGPCLLHNQDIADITLESRSSVSCCIDRVHCVKQSGISVWYVSACTVAKFVGGNSET